MLASKLLLTDKGRGWLFQGKSKDPRREIPSQREIDFFPTVLHIKKLELVKEGVIKYTYNSLFI